MNQENKVIRWIRMEGRQGGGWRRRSGIGREMWVRGMWWRLWMWNEGIAGDCWREERVTSQQLWWKNAEKGSVGGVGWRGEIGDGGWKEHESERMTRQRCCWIYRWESIEWRVTMGMWEEGVGGEIGIGLRLGEICEIGLRSEGGSKYYSLVYS